MAETATTLHALIQAGADEATALSSPGGVPLTFGALRALTENTVASSTRRESAVAIGSPSFSTTARKWPPPSSPSRRAPPRRR